MTIYIELVELDVKMIEDLPPHLLAKEMIIIPC
jgi:hypothetical protein